MRTLDATLQAIASGTEVATGFCFEFSISGISGATWRYTSFPQQVSLDGNTFTPKAIDLVDAKEGGRGDASTTLFTIECERMEPFLSFVGRHMPYPVTVTVWEVFIDDSDGTAYGDQVAEGELMVPTRSADKISAPFQPMISYINKKVPSILFSRLDQRVPYGDDFGVTATDFRVTATVTAVSANEVTSAAASGQADGYYAFGLLEYTRTVAGKSVTFRVPILNNTGGKFICAYPPAYLVATEQCYAYAGYSGTADEALNRFDNLSGFLGFPHMPKRNPVLSPQKKCSLRGCADPGGSTGSQIGTGPCNGDVVDIPTALCAWAAVENATQYYVQVYSDQNASNLVYTSGWIADTQHYVEDLDDGNYWWRVRARDENDQLILVSSLCAFTVAATQVQTYPDNEKVVVAPGGENVAFTWRAVDNGNEYKVQVYDDAGLTSLVHDGGWVAALTDDVPLPYGTDNYWWRIRVRDTAETVFLVTEAVAFNVGTS